LAAIPRDELESIFREWEVRAMSAGVEVANVWFSQRIGVDIEIGPPPSLPRRGKDGSIPGWYVNFMWEVERRRLALGWSMDKVTDKAGISERAYAKALYPDRPSGRMAFWPTLIWIIRAVFRGNDLNDDQADYEFLIQCLQTRRRPQTMKELRRRIRIEAAKYSPARRSQWMMELSKKGVEARMVKVPEWMRREIAREGGQARAHSLSPERRAQIAQAAALARWAKRNAQSPR
jgi:hypothetical protein